MTGVILSDLTGTVCLSNLLIMIRRQFEKSLERQLLVHPQKMVGKKTFFVVDISMDEFCTKYHFTNELHSE